jgi:hypothetical protein
VQESEGCTLYLPALETSQDGVVFSLAAPFWEIELSYLVPGIERQLREEMCVFDLHLGTKELQLQEMLPKSRAGAQWKPPQQSQTKTFCQEVAAGTTSHLFLMRQVLW